MTIRWTVLLASCFLIVLFSCEKEQKRILVYIPHEAADSADVPLHQLLEICKSERILASSSDAYLAEDSLQHYHAVVFAGFSPDLFSNRQQNDLERYIQSGAGMMVLNANRDTVVNWPWFESLTKERRKGHENPWSSRCATQRSRPKTRIIRLTSKHGTLTAQI